MSKPLFISETWLKDNTPISGNIDAKELLPFRIEAQQKYVPQLTGTKLYETLCDAINSETVSSDQTELLTLIRPALAYYIAADALPFIHWKIKQKAVVSGSENMQTATLKEVVYLRTELLDKAEFASQRVIDFLKKRSDDFPDYNDVDNEIHPTSHAYKTGIAFDPTLMSEDDRRLYRNWF